MMFTNGRLHRNFRYYYCVASFICVYLTIIAYIPFIFPKGQKRIEPPPLRSELCPPRQYPYLIRAASTLHVRILNMN
ncbi:hypothetical protein Y032_0167g131 [Ancylostoma ceylanicum]|nr:hypothetical protein Y032_0167g131 [Ancylostoma ceylanicum]